MHLPNGFDWTVQTLLGFKKTNCKMERCTQAADMTRCLDWSSTFSVCHCFAQPNLFETLLACLPSNWRRNSGRFEGLSLSHTPMGIFLILWLSSSSRPRATIFVKRCLPGPIIGITIYHQLRNDRGIGCHGLLQPTGIDETNNRKTCLTTASRTVSWSKRA